MAIVDGYTLLHLAAMDGHWKAAEALHQAGMQRGRRTSAHQEFFMLKSVDCCRELRELLSPRTEIDMAEDGGANVIVEEDISADGGNAPETAAAEVLADDEGVCEEPACGDGAAGCEHTPHAAQEEVEERNADVIDQDDHSITSSELGDTIEGISGAGEAETMDMSVGNGHLQLTSAATEGDAANDESIDLAADLDSQSPGHVRFFEDDAPMTVQPSPSAIETFEASRISTPGTRGSAHSPSATLRSDELDMELESHRGRSTSQRPMTSDLQQRPLGSSLSRRFPETGPMQTLLLRQELMRRRADEARQAQKVERERHREHQARQAAEAEQQRGVGGSGARAGADGAGQDSGHHFGNALAGRLPIKEKSRSLAFMCNFQVRGGFM